MKLVEKVARGGRFAVLSAASAALLLSACGEGKSDKTSQAAVKVNKGEITVHQINYALQRQPGLKPEQADAVGRLVMERLIDQELAVQQAQDMKLDRDPRVVQQIEAAKHEIVARAYVERIGEAAVKPTAAEITQYYSDKPELFKDRRIYSLQELVVEAKPEQFDELRARLKSSKSATEFAEYLKSANFRFNANQAVRSAEQLPLNNLQSIARMRDGESTASQTPNGLTALFLLNSRSQPVDEVAARPAIETFLVNQRKAELVQKNLKALRESAKIEYVGKFARPAQAAASAPAVPMAPAAPTPAAPAASTAAVSGGLDAATISKGMGIK